MVSERRATLGSVRAVTYAAPDLSLIEAAYGGTLGYRVIERSRVSTAQAKAWDAANVAGRDMVVMEPQSGEAAHLRFIQSASAKGWRALKTLGWNATEFVVQDVDALALQLQGSPFTTIGSPKALSRFPMIRAMQAIGPFGECCYFTEVGPGSGLDLAPALSFVGRVFIVVAAGADVNALYDLYAAFDNAVDPPVATPVKVISDAHGLPADTTHKHGLVRLPHGCLVELDAYPQSAPPRPVARGELPAGMAMVSFCVDELGDYNFIAPPAAYERAGERGMAACLRGAAGELIELETLTSLAEVHS